ncbi:MAG: cation:proton antiporter, partial [Bacteroidales bacterium]|nr:cation:proton antiporter [Bacteroidales bacterium]
MGDYFIGLNITFDIDYFPLLIVIATAWLIPMLLSVVKISKVPIVIVEIIAGYFIGNYILDSYSFESTFILEFLALTGFIFLMFLGGLEIDVDQIISSFPRKKLSIARFLKNPLLVGLLIFVITLLLSYGSAILLSGIVETKNTWYFSLIMVTTSVGIIVPVLKNNGEISSRFGQMIVVSAAIADILSIILFTYTAFIIKNGLEIDILLIFLLFILFFVFYRVGNRLKGISFFKKITYQLSHAASQIQIRGTLLLIFIFVVVAQFIDKEAVLLGAFLCGLLLSFFLHKERSLLILNLDGMGYGFFIPVFFIMVGAQFDPKALTTLDNSLHLFLILLLITLFAVKLIPSLLWVRLFGTRRAVSGGFLMASRLSLIIAASQIGLELGVISPAINSCFLVMAIITCFISPVIY